MKESDRRQRNALKLQELHPSVRPRIEAVILEMESFGYRPRIQEAWRSAEDQLAIYNAGKSKVKYGFHNATAGDGTKEALAADIWDDNRPFRAKTDFMLHLLAAAEKNDLTTGIRWNLTDDRMILIDEAIAEEDWKRPVWVGWDPLHVEVTGITVDEAQTGARPHAPDIPPTEPDSDIPENNEDNQYKVEPIKYKVENLDTSRTYQYELGTALRPTSLLQIPYISRLGQRIGSSQNDFGSEAATMILAAYTGKVTPPDELYEKFNVDKKPYLSLVEISNSLGSEGLSAQIKSNLTIKDLFGYLKSNVPIIIPVNYRILHDAGLTEKPFVGPHFSVVVGIDLKYIYVHDSMFTDPETGEAHPYPIDVFVRAWTETPAISIIAIPKRSAVIPSMAIYGDVAKRIRVTTDRLNVRQGPGPNYAVAFTINRGDEFVLIKEENAWGEIAPGRWISLNYTENVSAPKPAPETEGDSPPVEPVPSIFGNGTLIKVSLATSVPQNPEGLRPAQYIFNDTNIPPTHRDLCGDIALSMVYETVTNKKKTLGYIYSGIKNTTRKPTAGSIAYELAQQFAQTFPDGWKTHCYYLSYIYYFDTGNSHFLKESPGALKTSMTQKSKGELIEMISKMITDHTFVIAGVTINTKMQGPGAARLKPDGVGHWVVVTGFSNTFVYINNPFMNRREAYLWDEFLTSFVYWIVQIIPPENFEPQVYTGPMDEVHASMEQDRNII